MPHQPGNTSILHRDKAFEALVKDEAGIDKMLTPARAIRWLMSAMGRPMHGQPSPIEFRPIVMTDDQNTRVVATLAYKF